jgi:hypothetical protein
MKRSGFTIGIESMGDDIFVSMKAVGKLRHEDYQHINPVIDSALKGIEHPQVDVFLDASELEGWEPRAAWDDFKLGLKHGKEFRKIALLGNRKWQEMASRIGSWFISGKMKYFEDADEALNWLHQS